MITVLEGATWHHISRNKDVSNEMSRSVVLWILSSIDWDVMRKILLFSTWHIMPGCSFEHSNRLTPAVYIETKLCKSNGCSQFLFQIEQFSREIDFSTSIHCLQHFVRLLPCSNETIQGTARVFWVSLVYTKDWLPQFSNVELLFKYKI